MCTVGWALCAGRSALVAVVRLGACMWLTVNDCGCGAAAAVDADAVGNPAPDAVPDDIAAEVATASAEYDAERAWLNANANTPTP